MAGPEIETKGLTSNSRFFNLFHLLIDTLMILGKKKVTVFFFQYIWLRITEYAVFWLTFSCLASKIKEYFKKQNNVLSNTMWLRKGFLCRRCSLTFLTGFPPPSPLQVAKEWCYWVLSWVSILIWKVKNLVELSLTSCALSHKGN